jgi:hypothetical protein
MGREDKFAPQGLQAAGAGTLVKVILHSQYGPAGYSPVQGGGQTRSKGQRSPDHNARDHVSENCNVRNFTIVTKSMLLIAKLMLGIGTP